MTENTAETPETTTEEPAKANEGAGPKLHQEAARYRHRAKEAEANRDALAQRVEQLQSREVERLASKHLSAPADLLTLGGVTVADLLNDDGDVDPDKVSAVAAEVLGSRPGLKPNAPAFDPTQGSGGNPGKLKQPDSGSLFQN